MLSAHSQTSVLPTSHFATVGSVRLHYRQSAQTFGSRAENEPTLPIMFLHGFPEYSGAWTAYLEQLSSQFKVVAPDLRGYGLSDHPQGAFHYHIATLVADIIGLADQLDMPIMNVVGHDWGGILAWYLAAWHPARVGRLVVMNAPHPLIYERLYQSDPEQQKMAEYIGFLMSEGSEKKCQQDDYKWLRSVFGKSAVHQFTDQEWAGYREAWSQGLQGIEYYRANIGQPPQGQDKLARITPSTLVLWGERDRAISLKNLDGLADYAPNLQVKRYAHAGHFINHELSPIMIDEIREFCGQTHLKAQK